MVLLVIILNSVLIMASLSVPEFAKSSLALFLDWIFTLTFTLELTVKVVAMGLVLGTNTYLRSAWNVLDFIVVVTAFVGGDMAAMRCVRLLRPLRTLNKFKGLRAIVSTLLGALPALRDLLCMAAFVYGIFAITGMNMFGASVWSQCRVAEGPSAPGVWESVDGAGQLCGGGYQCTEPNSTCGNLLLDAKATPEQSWAEVSEDEDAAFGIMGFQHFGSAMLTVFVVSTMEDWNELMYRYMDEMGGPFPVFFFVMMVLLGNTFIMNLIMAILWEGFEDNQECIDQEDPDEDTGRMKAIQQSDVAGMLRTQLLQDVAMEKMKAMCFKFWAKETASCNYYWCNSHFSSLEDVMKFCSEVEAADILLKEAEEDELENRKSSHTRHSSHHISHVLMRFVERRVFVAAIFVFIIMNSLTLAMDRHPPLPNETQQVIKSLNLVFTVAFTLETILKLCAYGWRVYFKDKWNIFDFTVVVLSLLELMLGSKGGSVISALRSCRLLRIFKLARNVLSLRILLLVLAKAIAACANFCCVAAIFLYIFTLLGMQLFAQKLGEADYDRLPLHYDDPLNAFVSVFVVITGERWIGIMLTTGGTLQAAGHGQSWLLTMCFFILVLFVGNMVLLQLFMAILGASFGGSRETLLVEYHEHLIHLRRSSPCFKDLLLKRLDHEEEQKNVWLSKQQEPLDHLPLETGFTLLIFPLKDMCRQLVSHQYFERFILMMIFISSALLAIDTPYLDPSSSTKNALEFIDLAFTLFFFLEMIIKWLALGLFTLSPPGYFRSGWNHLDFVVVVMALLGQSKLFGSSFKIIRVLRALRPLRLIKRNPGMKVLVDGLIRAIPQLANTLCVSFLFFFVFAILSVNFFKGKMWHCDGVDEYMGAGTWTYGVKTEDECKAEGGIWSQDHVNFDDVFHATFALFFIANGVWTNVMLKGRDATGAGALLFFVFFVILGNFVILNLFIGIIVDEMAAARKEAEQPNQVLLSEEEEQWTELQKRILNNIPLRRKTEIRGSGRVHGRIAAWRQKCLNFVNTHLFEWVIGFCILANAGVMCVRHATMDEAASDIVGSINLVFAVIFTLEAAIKIFAMGFVYFDETWNRFDFIIVAITIIFMIVSYVADVGSFSAFLPVIRSFRVSRLLRLVRSARGLAMLFKTLFAVIPSLANVACLLSLLFFVFSILSIGFFSKVMPGEVLQGRVNFHDFGSSLLAWVVMATGEMWEDLIWDVATDREGCVQFQTYEDLQRDGPMECGSGAALPIFVSYNIAVTLVAMNLFVGVVLETFSDEKDHGLGEFEEPLNQFYEDWRERNPDASRLMPIMDFCDLLVKVPYPVGLKVEGDNSIHDALAQNLMKDLGKSSLPIFEKRGRRCIHLRDAMLYVTRRCCAFKTRPHWFQSKTVKSIDFVVFRDEIKKRYNLMFPELQETDSESTRILHRSGEWVEAEHTTAHEHAAFVIGRKMKARLMVRDIKRKQSKESQDEEFDLKVEDDAAEVDNRRFTEGILTWKMGVMWKVENETENGVGVVARLPIEDGSWRPITVGSEDGKRVRIEATKVTPKQCCVTGMPNTTGSFEKGANASSGTQSSTVTPLTPSEVSPYH